MHVLVVEDDLEMKDLLHHALKKEGYQVSQALGLAQALRLVQEHPDIDVVVVDVHTRYHPGAEEVMRQIRQHLHNSHYIVATGDWDTLEPACRERDDTTLLRKPYGKQDLLHAVERCNAGLRLARCREPQS